MAAAQKPSHFHTTSVMALKNFEDFKYYWLLIAGTTESPKQIKACDKKRDNGKYLSGISADLQNMSTYIEKNEDETILNKVQDMRYLKSSTVLENIRILAQEVKEQPKSFRAEIYYTGHGQENTGNWCFADDKVVTLKQIIDIVRSITCKTLWIYADCCYSGNWAVELAQYKTNNVVIFAASRPGKVAYDSKEGGLCTLKWVEKYKSSHPKLKKLHSCWAELDGHKKYSMNYSD